MLNASVHARTRNAQRNLNQDDLEYVKENGEEFHKSGAIFYFLRERDLNEIDRRNSRCSQLVGTAVVIAKDDGTVITAWRNRSKGLKIIKRKPGYERRLRV